MKEKDIIEILKDDKNYKDMKIPFEDGGGSTTYRELDFSKVAPAILSKLKEKERVLAKGIVKYGGTLGHTRAWIDRLDDGYIMEGRLASRLYKYRGKQVTIKVVIEDE